MGGCPAPPAGQPYLPARPLRPCPRPRTGRPQPPPRRLPAGGSGRGGRDGTGRTTRSPGEQHVSGPRAAVGASQSRGRSAGRLSGLLGTARNRRASDQGEAACAFRCRGAGRLAAALNFCPSVTKRRVWVVLCPCNTPLPDAILSQISCSLSQRLNTLEEPQVPPLPVALRPLPSYRGWWC